MKIIFAGTAEFGIPTLDKIISDFEIVLIITQPDKPAGRNRQISSSPIKIWAQKNSIPLEQPERIQNIEERIRELEPDLLLVAAYGQIIPKQILDIPKHRSVNIHGSILPKYRGPSPIQAAITAGDKYTGVTFIQMDEQMDHGPILATVTVGIEDSDNYLSLYKKLSEAAAERSLSVLTEYLEGKMLPMPQNHGLATYCKLLTRSDARIVWSRPSQTIRNMIRGMNPEPGTWTTLNGKNYKILSCGISNDHKIELPGKIYVFDSEPAVKTSDYGLVIKTIQPEGKTPITGKDFLNGLNNLSDKIFI